MSYYKEGLRPLPPAPLNSAGAGEWVAADDMLQPLWASACHSRHGRGTVLASVRGARYCRQRDGVLLASVLPSTVADGGADGSGTASSSMRRSDST